MKNLTCRIFCCKICLTISTVQIEKIVILNEVIIYTILQLVRDNKEKFRFIFLHTIAQ